ncbi:hypothetical protein MNV49_005882 [Pseudohyphozyma bogoriensis]|nr:hypothetical protein MNV49_005882 [Pseudohyphozyma bogoriensis]
MATPPLPAEVLILVWLHGFKGGSDTFAMFPERVQHILASSNPDTFIVNEVYPPYDTRGDLIDAVVNHTDWLEGMVATKTKEYRDKGGTGPVRVVLLGHSMGGLVIADTLLSILRSAPPKPTMLGIIAYDTPYFGLNPIIFKNTAEKVLNYAQQGQAVLTGLGVGLGAFKAFASKSSTPSPNASRPSTPSGKAEPPSSSKAVAPQPVATGANGASSSWFSLPVIAGAVTVAAGAAGAAYWQKDKLAQQWSWATSHLSFVGELWNVKLLENRLEKVEQAMKDKNVGFHCFYTLLPKTTSTARTFIILPTTSIGNHFSSNINNRASDEIGAHVSMFTDEADGMYALGSESCHLITSWLVEARKRGPQVDEQKQSQPEREPEQAEPEKLV